MSEPSHVFAEVEHPIRVLTGKLISEIAEFSRDHKIPFAVAAYGVAKNLEGFYGNNDSPAQPIVTAPPITVELLPSKPRYVGRPGAFQCKVCIPPRGFRSLGNLEKHKRQEHAMTKRK